MLEIIIMSVKNMLITVGGTSAASLKNLNVQLKSKGIKNIKENFLFILKRKKGEQKKWLNTTNKLSNSIPCKYLSHFFTSSWNISSNKLSFFPHIQYCCLPSGNCVDVFQNIPIPAILKRDRDYARH